MGEVQFRALTDLSEVKSTGVQSSEDLFACSSVILELKVPDTIRALIKVMTLRTL